MPVVFVNARGTEQDQWDQVLPRLYTETTITYDRPGIGDSGPLPPHSVDHPRTFGAIADELHTLLETLGVESPHVVVGHSIGGLIAMMYGARHSRHTSGLVLVDCTTVPYLANTVRSGREDSNGSALLDIPGSIAEIDAAEWTPIPATVLASAPGRWTRLPPTAAAEFAPLSLADVDSEWQAGQRQLTERLNALLVVADWAGHHVAADQPELVAACVSAVQRAARSNEAVTIPEAQLRYAGGSTDQP